MTKYPAICRQWQNIKSYVDNDKTFSHVSTMAEYPVVCRQWHNIMPYVDNDRIYSHMSTMTKYPTMLNESQNIKLHVDNNKLSRYKSTMTKYPTMCRKSHKNRCMSTMTKYPAICRQWQHIKLDVDTDKISSHMSTITKYPAMCRQWQHIQPISQKGMQAELHLYNKYPYMKIATRQKRRFAGKHLKKKRRLMPPWDREGHFNYSRFTPLSVQCQECMYNIVQCTHQPTYVNEWLHDVSQCASLKWPDD